MFDFSKNRKNGARVMVIIICALIVFGMVIGLLVASV